MIAVPQNNAKPQSVRSGEKVVDPCYWSFASQFWGLTFH